MTTAQPPVDLIIQADRIHTMTTDVTAADAVAVRDGRVVAVGTAAELAALAGPSTVTRTYPGATLTPGLNDSHTHVVWGAELTRGVQLTDLGIDEVRERLAGELATLEGDEWLFGWGLDPNLFTETGFDGRRFDDVTGERPMFLRMRDAHSAVVNSAAIAQVGLTGAETFPDESRVGVDTDGRPNGYLLELSAMNLVIDRSPEQTFEERAAQVLDVLSGMSKTGITSTHVLDLHAGTQEILTHLEERGDLPVQLRISPFVFPSTDRAGLEERASLQGTGGRRWVIEGVKFFIDGTIDNGSAWLHQPDLYGQGTDSIWTDPVAYQRALRFFAERGISTATHAIGDQGVDFVLDSFEALGDVTSRAAHRIEHIETIPDSTVARFAKLGIVASMQPIHGTHHTKADRSDNWSQRLGEERASHGWRTRDIREAGGTVALGSDWPITPFDPREMMADSILRYPVGRPGTPPVQPEQGLTALQALEGYTSHSAIAAGRHGDEGVIAAGARAHFTVFETDPLEAAATELPQVGITATYVDGQLTHS